MDYDERDLKEVRRENKSGWLEISDDEDLRFIIEAILETSPKSHIETDEISERSGVEETKTKICLEYLHDLGVLVEVEDNIYKSNEEENPVIQELFHLNSAVNSRRGDVKSVSERLED